MSDDWDKIAKYEKAISKKYGKEAIINPSSNWDEEKEKDYIDQSITREQKQQHNDEQNEKQEVDGFLVSKKLLNKEKKNRTCPVCDEFSFELKDDLYMEKFECCYGCYIQHIEHRSERWLKGWRPNKENK